VAFLARRFSFECWNFTHTVDAFAFVKYYMGGYFERTLEACCRRYFNYDYNACVGTSGHIPNGFYPNWGETEIKCLAASDEMPDYMHANTDIWVYNDIESCCKNYYSWTYTECVVGSGGQTAASDSGKWYVNHQETICQQDCEKGGNVTCGGLAKVWEVLYESVEECCANQLSWIPSATCKARSTFTNAVGTGEWYIDYSLEMVRRS